MQPHDPIPLIPGDTPIEPAFGLVLLGLGAAIFVYIMVRLVGEYRRRNQPPADGQLPSDDG